jgi:hypothetical protein
MVIVLASTSALAAGPVPVGGFRNCKAANAAGYWDIKRGTPAYHTRLDRDRDGVACERKK